MARPLTVKTVQKRPDRDITPKEEPITLNVRSQETVPVRPAKTKEATSASPGWGALQSEVDHLGVWLFQAEIGVQMLDTPQASYLVAYDTER